MNKEFNELLLMIHLQKKEWLRIHISVDVDSHLVLRVDTNHPQDRRHFESGLTSGRGCHPHYDGTIYNDKLGRVSWVEEYISIPSKRDTGWVNEKLWLRYALPNSGVNRAIYNKDGSVVIYCDTVKVDNKRELIDLANILARSMYGDGERKDRKVRIVGLKNARVRFVREAKVDDLPCKPMFSSLYETVNSTFPRPDKAENIWALE